MKLFTRPPAVTDAQGSVKSQYTLLAVSLSAGLAVLAGVVLCSRIWQLACAFGTYLSDRFAVQLAARFLRYATWSYEIVARDCLMGLYLALLVMGLSHANRTRAALAARRPKAEGKPKAGFGVNIAFGIAALAVGFAGAKCGLSAWPELFATALKNASPGFVIRAGVMGSVMLWFMVLAVYLTACSETGLVARREPALRVMAIGPGALLTYLGFSLANLGLLLGLWVMMVMLMGLEEKELPPGYPDQFPEEPAASAPSATAP